MRVLVYEQTAVAPQSLRRRWSRRQHLLERSSVCTAVGTHLRSFGTAFGKNYGRYTYIYIPKTYICMLRDTAVYSRIYCAWLGGGPFGLMSREVKTEGSPGQTASSTTLCTHVATRLPGAMTHRPSRAPYVMKQTGPIKSCSPLRCASFLTL